MGTINREALAQIRDYGLTRAAYVSCFSRSGVWYGDSCGCVDDRCIGYHHEAGESCHCLSSWIREARVIRRRREAIALDAVLVGLQSAVDAAEVELDQLAGGTPERRAAAAAYFVHSDRLNVALSARGFSL